MSEYVDILDPPMFLPSGVTKPLQQAWHDEDWIGTFNLWIVNTEAAERPSLVYQQRSAKSSWEPGKLDVTAGGHYSAGETIIKGVREVKEELGRTFEFTDLHYLGRRLNVSRDVNGYRRNNVVDVCMVVDGAPLSQYRLEEAEVSAIFLCPIDELIRVHTEPEHSFIASGLSDTGRELTKAVTAESFPLNWDRYHFKVALIAQRLLAGDRYLVY